MTSAPITEDRPRVRKDVARNRALLLSTADELMAEKGLDLTFHELAAAAGVGVGTVYRHFADKDELIGAMVEQRFDQARDILLEAGEIEDPVVSLREAVLRSCELHFTDRGVFQLMMTQAVQYRNCAKERLLPVINDIVERAIASGRLRPDFSTTDLPMIFMMTGKLSHALGTIRPDLWRRYVNAILDGFLVHDADRAGSDVPPPAEQADLECIIDSKS